MSKRVCRVYSGALSYIFNFLKIENLKEIKNTKKGIENDSKISTTAAIFRMKPPKKHKEYS